MSTAPARSPARLARPPHVLVSRVDRIGDVVLTLPLCGLLKARLGAHVTFLAQGYTRELLAAAPDVDEVLEWDAADDAPAARACVAGARADVILHALPRSAIARAAWSARVRRRVGTSRRAYHWLYCNDLVALGRRDSDWHEAQLNVQLARPLLGREVLGLTPADLAPYARLHPRAPLPPQVDALLAGDRFAVVLHPLSLGSAREWPVAPGASLDAVAVDMVRARVEVWARER